MKEKKKKVLTTLLPPSPYPHCEKLRKPQLSSRTPNQQQYTLASANIITTSDRPP